MTTLLNAIYEHKCLVIKNQNFSHKGYKRFGSEWGILIKHMLEYLRAPSFPELMVIGNTEKKDEEDDYSSKRWYGRLKDLKELRELRGSSYEMANKLLNNPEQ